MRIPFLAAIVVLLPLLDRAQAQVVPQAFSDCADCPEMVALPGGSFTMGVPRGEEEREGVPVELRGRSAPTQLARPLSLASPRPTPEPETEAAS